MKKKLTKEYILSNKGCYSTEQVLELSFIEHKNITILKLVKSEIKLKDKFWFVIRKCELTDKQKRLLAIGVAEIVLHLYEDKNPDKKVPREAIQAAKDYLNNLISRETLISKRDAAYATAYAAAYAAYAAAYAVDAAYAAANAAYAAAYAANAAYAAAYAANAVDAAAYAAANAANAVDAAKTNLTDVLLTYLINFIKAIK